MATRYWVNGAGTWNNSNTANWSSSSGGASGASAPVSTDIVIFDSLSGTGICTTANGSACATATLNSSSIDLILGESHSMSGTFTLSLGNLSLGNNSLTCNIFSTNNSGVRTINFGVGDITLTGSSSTIWSAATNTNLTVLGVPRVNCIYSGSTGTRTINNGSTLGGSELNAISFYITAGSDTISFTSNIKNAIKTLDFTGFTGIFLNTIKTVYGDFILSPGMTVNAGSLATTFASTSGIQQITTNGKTLDFPLTFNGVGSTFAFQDALTQGSTRAFTITNGTVQLKAGVTSTVGVFGTTGTTQKFLQSTIAGSKATLSQASGTVSVSHLTIKDINATGGATWNAFTTNNNVDAGNNLGWDFSTQIGRYIYTRRKNKRILP